MRYGPFVILFYCAGPAMFAVGSLVGSALLSWRTRSVFHFCVTGALFVGVFCSLFVLYDIFRLGGEASFRPHILIATLFAVFAGQAFYVLRRRPDEGK